MQLAIERLSGALGLGRQGYQIAGILFGGLLLALLAVSIMTQPVLLQCVVLLSVLVVVFFFTRPAVALLTFFAARAIFDLLWWVPGEVMGLNVLELFTGAVTGLGVVLFILEFKRMENHPALPAFLAFCFMMGVASLRNLELRSGLEILARYISPLLIMFLTSAFFTTRAERIRLLKVITGVMVIPIAVSLKNFFGGQASTYQLAGYDRLMGGYQNLHNHALMMMFITTLGMWWFLNVERQRKWTRLGLVAYMACSVFLLYNTYVRTGMVGLAGFAGVYLWVSGRRSTLVWMAIALAAFVLLTPAMQDRFKDVVYFFEDQSSVEMDKDKLGSGRWGLWTFALTRFLRYPLGDIALGLGLGKHWVITADYYNPYMAHNETVDTHSDYLTLMLQVGPIAVFAYVAMQFAVVRYGYRLLQIGRDHTARAIGGYIVAYTASAVITTSISNAFIQRTTLGWYYWGIAGIMFAEYFDAVKEGQAERERSREVADPALQGEAAGRDPPLPTLT